jgi:hypothetical protein
VILKKNFKNIYYVFCSKLFYFYKLCVIALVYRKTPIFFAENRQKSQKIVIITLTPVLDVGTVHRVSLDMYLDLRFESNRRIRSLYVFQLL